MNVLHLVAGGLAGGAARGAYTLHLGLMKLGIESYIVTNECDAGDNSRVVQMKKPWSLWNRIASRIEKKWIAAFPDKVSPIFSFGWRGVDFLKSKVYENADIVHLHYINGLVNVADLRRIKKPIVWTIRDMWPMTGGCHCSMGCKRYVKYCGRCRHLKSKMTFDPSLVILFSKRVFYPQGMRIAGISDWISTIARESSVFRKCSVQTIPNAIDTDVFVPRDKLQARQHIGFVTDKKVILIAAHRPHNTFKGVNKWLHVINSIDPEKYAILLFGQFDDDLMGGCGCEWKNMGFIKDDSILNMIYACADVYLTTAIEEAFGKTVVEAMACEVPAVCFDTAGPGEIVDHRINGYKAEPFDTDDIVNGIAWVLENNKDGEIGKAARRKTLEKYDFRTAAATYAKLYEQMLS